MTMMRSPCLASPCLAWVGFGLFLLAASTIGCSSSETAEGEGDESSTAAVADAKSQPAAAKPMEAKVPVQFAGRKEVELPFLDGSKKVETIVDVKHYSDESFEYDGAYKEFWYSGKPFIEGSYKADRRDGPRSYYFENGQLARKVNYKGGRPDGRWTRFNEDGTKEADVSYKEGKRDGTWVYYGKPPGSEEAPKEKDTAADAKKPAKADQPATTGATPKATKTAEKPAKEKAVATKTDETKTDDAVTDDAEAAESKPEATVAKSTLPQPIVRQEVYRDGFRDGTWIAWHPNGKKAAESNYRAGKKHGKEITYWESTGHKQSEIEYRDNLPDGLAIVWSEDGSLSRQRRYSKGNPVSNTVKDATSTAGK